MTRSPSRDDTETIARRTPETGPVSAARRCPACAAMFAPTGRRRYCSSACRKRAFRARRALPTAPVIPAGASRREHTIYECGHCGERRLGQQYCPDCATFARSAGPGGACPCCGEPVTVADLGLAITDSGDRR
jgi:hypothetical protein